MAAESGVSSVKQQSLQIPDNWKLMACSLPVVGILCSAICHKTLSYQIANEYRIAQDSHTNNHSRAVELIELRKGYLEADTTRNFVSAVTSMAILIAAVFAAALKIISAITFFKVALLSTLAIPFFISSENAATNRMGEDACLISNVLR